MRGNIEASNVHDIVRHYEQSLVKGETVHANNIKNAHTDLLNRFVEVDERLARKP